MEDHIETYCLMSFMYVFLCSYKRTYLQLCNTENKALPRNHRLTNRKSNIKCRYLHQRLIRGVQQSPQTIQNMVTVSGCQSELNGQTLLLKTLYSWVTGYGAIMLVLIRKLDSIWPAFTVPWVPFRLGYWENPWLKRSQISGWTYYYYPTKWTSY